MSVNESRGQDNRNNNDNNTNGYWAAGAVAASITAVAGGIYWLMKGKQPDQQKQQKNTQIVTQSSPPPPNGRAGLSITSYLTNALSKMDSNRYSASERSGKFSSRPPPDNPCISNLNSLLSDIFIRFIQIKEHDFRLHYDVFSEIFLKLHQKMKDVDLYYRKYSSTVQFAGSHYDNLRIKKPDEFDMDIVIGLPLNLEEHRTNVNESDIFIEPKAAGYVQLKMGVQFKNLPMRDKFEWENNKAAYAWMDSSGYLLRSKFTDWFKSVVNKALMTFEHYGNSHCYVVNGVRYNIRLSESGPAKTLIIENIETQFRLDVDLVPALKFPESRWPIGVKYRHIPAECRYNEWMVVGKSVRNGAVHDEQRSWRIALHNQERKLMYNSGNLRQAVRLLKKLRDSLGMTKIASYYVKTLFFWEIEKNDKNFWHKSDPASLFKLMVNKLYTALQKKNIPYYWNKNNNLIGNVSEGLLNEYAAKLKPLVEILEDPKKYKQVAKFLLTPNEFKEYNMRFLHI